MKNIDTVIFDLGNVVVRWSPTEILNLTFNNPSNLNEYMNLLFKDGRWEDVNRGKLTLEEFCDYYHTHANIPTDKLALFRYYLTATQIPIFGSQEIIKSLSSQNYRLMILSDNVPEIAESLRQQYDFWQYFDEIILSYDYGTLKADKTIFPLIIEKFDLDPSKSVFIDDLPANIAAAKICDFNTILYQDYFTTRAELASLNIKLPLASG